MPDPGGKKTAVARGPSATATIVKKAAMTRGGEKGGSFTVRVKLNGMKGKVVNVRGVFVDARGDVVRSKRVGYDAGGYLAAAAEVTATSDEYEEDVVLFFPLTLLPGGRGSHTFTIHVVMQADGRSVLESMPSRSFTITRK
jgi:hypothetical protein